MTESTHLPSTVDSDCEALLEAATPELYRQNAFRIAGLPITVGMGEVKRRAQSLSRAKRLGLNAPPGNGGYLPLQPPPDEDTVGRAVQRLHGPESRLIDEFFWFWPEELGRDEDPGLALLTENRIDEAQTFWRRREYEGSSARTSTHNLAVLSHLAALDLEHRAVKRPLSEKAVKVRDKCWDESYLRWRRLLNDEWFWSRLTARIRQLDDPRLTTGTARRIRKSLPKAILLINARLAVRAAEKQNRAETTRHVSLIRNSGFGDGLIDETLRNALGTIRQRIKGMCDSVSASAKESPDTAIRAADSLLEDAGPLLSATDLLLPPEDPVACGVHDRVAEAALECAIVFANRTADWDASRRLLEAVYQVASSGPVRTRVKENLDLVGTHASQKRKFEELKERVANNEAYYVQVPGQSALVPPMCTCCLEPADLQQTVSCSWEERAGSNRVIRHTRSFGFPLCRACRKHQDELNRKQCLLVILAVATSLVPSYLVGSNMGQISCGAFLFTGIVFSAVAVAIFSLLFRVEVLDTSHASRGPAVEMAAASEGEITFKFLNPVYAHLFAEGNGREIKVKKETKHSHGKYLIKGRSAFGIIAWVLVLTLVGHGIVFAVVREQWTGRAAQATGGRGTPSSSYNPPSAYGTPSTTPSPKSAPDSYGLRLLESQLEQSRARILSMEAELRQLDSQLETLSLRIQTYRASIDSYKSRIRIGLGVDEAAYRAAADSHNRLVDEHTQILNKALAKKAQMEAEIARHNDMVRRYNSGVR